MTFDLIYEIVKNGNKISPADNELNHLLKISGLTRCELVEAHGEKTFEEVIEFYNK